MHRTKVFTITKALALAAILVGLLFAFQFARANFQPSHANPGLSPLEAAPSSPTPPALADGWLMYVDPDKEFSFAYPPEALINAGQNPLDLAKNIDIQFKLPDTSYQGMSIRLERNPQRLQNAGLAVQLFEASSQQQASAEFVDSLQPVSIGGKAAVRAVIPAANTEFTLIAAYDERVLYLAPVHASPATSVEKESLELFYQVLNSFRFAAPE